MKNVMMKISALLLSLWYCLSIIGFDVHTCRHGGDSIVTTSFTAIDCETIHPEHDACAHSHHDSDCHCHEACCADGGTGFHPQKCCHDDYQVIFLTGIRMEQEHEHYDECHCGCCPCLEASVAGMTSSFAENFNSRHPYIPDSGLIVPDCQAFFSIWRI